MSTNETDPRLIRLSPRDNVLVLGASIAAGEVVAVEGAQVRMAAALSLGHKIAACAIAEGETILKYGAPIGVATADIAQGAHVHVHNVASAYTPSYVVEA